MQSKIPKSLASIARKHAYRLVGETAGSTAAKMQTAKSLAEQMQTIKCLAQESVGERCVRERQAMAGFGSKALRDAKIERNRFLR